MTHDHPLRADWQRAHEELAAFAKARAHLDWEEGTLLLRALRCHAHVHLGFGSFGEYVERLFGYKARWTAERLRVAESLERLPAIEQSLRDGNITWSAARELTRVAVAETENDWLEATRRRCVR